MDDAARRELLDLFGDRCCVDPGELRLYDHDHLPIAGQVRAKIDPVPDAVVKPTSADEVARLVEFALFHQVPLVPRGGASERYGGATPTKGGVVVDMTLMDEVVQVDKGTGTCRVQAGCTFAALDEALAKEGLMATVRSTGPVSATVGGFAAHGGTGVGSLQFGPFAETVEALEVVTPKGDVREVTGRDRHLYLGTHGAMGILTELTLSVQKREDLQPVLVAFDSLQQMADLLREHQLYTVPLWSVHFKGPGMTELRKEAGQEAWLPADKWCVLFVFRKKEWAGTFETQVHREYSVQDVFWEVIERHDGEQVTGDAAQKEYDHLHEDLAYTKLGPGFVATDGRVPLDKLVHFVDRAVDRLPNEPAGVSGHIVAESGPIEARTAKARSARVTVHMADDLTRPEYDLAAGAAFGVADAAKGVGGSVHATGLLFAHEAKRFYGERWDEIKRYKEAMDPADLLNPGKLTPVRVKGPLGVPVKLTTLSRLGEPVAMLAAPFIGYEGPDEQYISDLAVAEVLRTRRGGPSGLQEVAFDVNACTQCGYCIDQCEVLDPLVFESSGTRGKLYALREHVKGDLDLTGRLVDRMYQCTECGYCDEICPVGIRPTRIYRTAKRRLAGRAPDGRAELRSHMTELGNPFGESREKRGAWVPDGARVLGREAEGTDGEGTDEGNADAKDGAPDAAGPDGAAGDADEADEDEGTAAADEDEGTAAADGDVGGGEGTDDAEGEAAGEGKDDAEGDDADDAEGEDAGEQRSGPGVLLHAGCAAAYRSKQTAEQAWQVLDKLGLDPAVLGADEVCAGGPLVTGGFAQAFEEHAAGVIRTLSGHGVETVVCLGAEEAKTFREDYPAVAERRGLTWDVEVKTFDQVVAEAQGKGQLSPKPAEPTGEEGPAKEELEAMAESDDPKERAKAKAKLIALKKGKGKTGGGDDEGGNPVLTYSPPQLTRVLGLANGVHTVLGKAEGMEPVEADLRYGVGIGGNVPDWFPDLARRRAEEFFAREKGRADLLVVSEAESLVHLKAVAKETGAKLEVKHLAEVVLDRFELSSAGESEEDEEAGGEEEVDLSHLPPKQRAIQRAKLIAKRMKREGG